MSEKPFPLELLGVLFSRTIVQAIHGYDPAAPNEQLTPVNQVKAQKDANEEDIYWCLMHTVFNKERSVAGPYLVDVECLVKFRLVSPLSEDRAKTGVLITGHNIAYGAIREAVSWITSRHVHGPLVLGISVLNLVTPAGEKPDAEQPPLVGP